MAAFGVTWATCEIPTECRAASDKAMSGFGRFPPSMARIGTAVGVDTMLSQTCSIVFRGPRRHPTIHGDGLATHKVICSSSIKARGETTWPKRECLFV